MLEADPSSDTSLAFWAKLPRQAESRGTYHPLLCHMLDVACVARHLWRDVLPRAARQQIAAALGIDESSAQAWVCFFAGLHDLGKASPAFATRDLAAQSRLRAAGFSWSMPVPEAGHGVITASALPDILVGLGLTRDVASRVATALGGHHGTLPRNSVVDGLSTAAVGGPRWARARVSLAQGLATLLDVPLCRPPQALDNVTAMQLAGLTSVADWIGSAEAFFPYADVGEEGATLDIKHYARQVDAKAHTAMETLAWLGWSPPPERAAFSALFPGLAPRPLQSAAIALADEVSAPALVLIEAPTGEGKTEAAMYLADAWSATSGQRGCYFALPTQATSNQMFSRVKAFLAERYPADLVNLHLLHGHAALSAEFQALRRNAEALLTPTCVAGERAHDGASAAVIAGEWFTHRKRGLLAPFGVGTVDQALLAALQTRHVFVRLFGLGQKVVIVDEIHAYDVYMTRLLERLLEWLGALGSPVILLSATLPRAKRTDLLRAYRRGLTGGEQEACLPSVAPYPVITAVSATAAVSRSVETASHNRREVALRWVDGRLPELGVGGYALGERLADALAGGGCAAIICNTVRRAQEVYLALRPYFPGLADDGLPQLDLFHARYLFAERERREQRALLRFGKPGGAVTNPEGDEQPVRRPSTAVLVATQVIEQSLDLDFDLMVSDPSPVDLLLQRMGRLHRHSRARPDGLLEPTLWLVSPRLEPEGVPVFDRGTQAVYDQHVLLRTWLALHERNAIRVPDDVEALIEATYDERGCPEDQKAAVREAWESSRAQREEQARADASEASERWLRPPYFGGALWRLAEDPREEDAPDFHPAHQALTRLAETTVQVVCLYGTPECACLRPDNAEQVNLARVPDLYTASRLLRASVGIADRRVVHRLLAQEPPAAWVKSSLLRHHRLLLLDAEGRARVGNYRIEIDDEVGVQVYKPDKEDD